MHYKISIQPSGIEFSADENLPILSSALHHNIGLPYGCRGGACGTCKSKILSGEVHYDVVESVALTEPEKAEKLVLLCQAKPRSDVVIEQHLVPTLADYQIKKLPCRVTEKTLMNHDVVRLCLKLPVTEPLNFRAGQYVDILLPDNRRRSFSLANPPHENQFIEMHIRHVEGGSFTSYVFNELEEKTILRVEGPLGAFTLQEESPRPAIFMAGGTGFAPVKSMIEYALHHQLEKPMYLYWGARTRRDLYLHDLAQQWTRMNPLIKYIPVLSEAVDEKSWQGRKGFVHDAIAQDFPDLSGFDIYACGPPVMIEAGQQRFPLQGLPLDQYYSDAFEYQLPIQTI